MLCWLSDRTGWPWLERLAYGPTFPTRSLPRRPYRRFFH